MNTHFSKFIVFLLILFFAFYSCCEQSGKEYDLVIKGGRIIDGTGNPYFYGDVGISEDRIAKIGKISESKAQKVINANGLYVVPGFIDVHTHTDRLIDSLTQVKNYLLQGVTTVVGGNCGGSRYPLAPLFKALEEKGISIVEKNWPGPD